MSQLFTDLMALSANEAFYYVDQEGADGAEYRIFLYRLASYTDFLLPGALESRGIMYRNDPVAGWVLVSRPMQKFFNWNENPFTMNVDLTKIEYAMVKEDGSLISTYIGTDGILRLKTKGSLHSEQAIAATKWIYNGTPFSVDLLERVQKAEELGYTVNMEWTSPLNRIVVAYSTERLIVLNARDRETGKYMAREDVERFFGPHAVKISNLMVHDVAKALGTEGIVAFFGDDADPQFMKVKADAYLKLHRLKDGVNQPNALFEAVVGDVVDDLRASFVDDPAVQLMINHMERLVHDAYNHFDCEVRQIHAKYRDCDRKEFAIAARKEADTLVPLDSGAAFSVAMNMYLGRDERMKEMFTRSAQSRIVAEYRSAIAGLISSQILEGGE